MSNLFKDSNINNVTLEEYGAMQKILKSDRGALLARELLCQMSEMDENAPPYFLGIIPKICQIQAAKLTTKVHNMRCSIGALGRRLTADKTSRTDTPRFLSPKYREMLEISAWEMLEFIQEFANFQEYAREVELGTRRELPKASVACQCDDLTLTYILRFCKFLDDLETTSIEKLVSDQVFDCNPNMENMIEWHRQHRSEWDDVSDRITGKDKLC